MDDNTTNSLPGDLITLRMNEHALTAVTDVDEEAPPGMTWLKRCDYSRTDYYGKAALVIIEVPGDQVYIYDDEVGPPDVRGARYFRRDGWGRWYIGMCEGRLFYIMNKRRPEPNPTIFRRADGFTRVICFDDADYIEQP